MLSSFLAVERASVCSGVCCTCTVLAPFNSEIGIEHGRVDDRKVFSFIPRRLGCPTLTRNLRFLSSRLLSSLSAVCTSLTRKLGVPMAVPPLTHLCCSSPTRPPLCRCLHARFNVFQPPPIKTCKNNNVAQHSQQNEHNNDVCMHSVPKKSTTTSTATNTTSPTKQH
ncbi:unnamed protein product [Ectocarpus sp. 12 AP-2014]